MKSRLVLVASIAILAAACSAGNMEWKGALKGTYELNDAKDTSSSAYPRPTPLETGKGSARLYTGLVDHIRLGAETPIPDCTFKVEKWRAIDTTMLEYKIKDSEKAHTGETDDGKGCRGRIDKAGPLVAIDILNASIQLNSTGEIQVSVEYVPTDRETSRIRTDSLYFAARDHSKERVLFIKGERGWF
jgi:hypothetical protein